MQKAFAVLTYTVPGMPLVYSGQEVGLNHRLEFFEKDEIKWSDDKKLTAFYMQLDQLKHQNPALWAGIDGGEMRILTTTAPEQVFAFTRTKGDNELFVLLNLSRKNVSFKFDEMPLNSYVDAFTGKDVTFSTHLKMQPCEYKIFLKK